MVPAHFRTGEVCIEFNVSLPEKVALKELQLYCISQPDLLWLQRNVSFVEEMFCKNLANFTEVPEPTILKNEMFSSQKTLSPVRTFTLSKYFVNVCLSKSYSLLLQNKKLLLFT